MPKIVTPLSLSQIKTAKPKEKVYKLPDGGGLALWILPSGSKSWRLQYRRPDPTAAANGQLAITIVTTLTDGTEQTFQIQ